MQRKSDERKGDLRNASVLEVIVAIIIVLVILLHSNNLKFANQKDALNQKIIELTDRNDKLQKLVSELKKEKRKLTKKVKDLESRIEVLKKYVDANAIGGTVVSDLLDNLRKLEDENAILKEKVTAVLKKLKDDGKGGVDKPFCRLPVLDNSIRQKHKWLGQITWTENGIIFVIDDRLDKDAARLIPGVYDLEAGSPLSRNSFKNAAQLAFADSKRQDPECRYNMIVKVDPKVDPPSSFILLVEAYFYKGLRRL